VLAVGEVEALSLDLTVAPFRVAHRGPSLDRACTKDWFGVRPAQGFGSTLEVARSASKLIIAAHAVCGAGRPSRGPARRAPDAVSDALVSMLLNGGYGYEDL
jgi:hypothetical protein